MRSILIEDFIAMNADAIQTKVKFKDEKGVEHSGFAIAKPLNYKKECVSEVSEADRKEMAQEVLDGRAIAVHYTEDEIALGEVPTLYKRATEEYMPEDAEAETEEWEV